MINGIEDKTLDDNLKMIHEKLTVVISSIADIVVTKLMKKPILDTSINDIRKEIFSEINEETADDEFTNLDVFFGQLKEGLLLNIEARVLRALICLKLQEDNEVNT